MPCTTSLTLNQSFPGDMGLQGAVYESTTNAIYGVRGEWLFKFSPVDGSLISSQRFKPGAGGWSTITAFGGNIYIGTTWFPHVDSSAPLIGFPLHDIYQVSAATLLPGVALGLAAKLGTIFNPCSIEQYWFNGWFGLTNDGTNLRGTNGDLFRVNPTNIAGYLRSSFGQSYDCFWDSDHSVLWVTEGAVPNVYAFLGDYSNDTFNSGSMSLFVSGVTYCSAVQKTYFVQGDFNIGFIDASNIINLINTATQFPFTLVNTGRISANPFRVKAVNGLAGNPYNGKVLIPAWNDDTVLIWNTTTNNVADMVVRTGFTAPFDIVNCPSASFAVQTGPVGLKLI